jgi:uncharacterized protein (TIGR00725 family)
MSVTRLPVVGVMGSHEHPHTDLAKPLGELIASLPVHLLTGSGPGVMGSVSAAFANVKDRKGLCIGVVPAESLDHPTRTPTGYPNAHVELAIRTHLVRKQPYLWDGLTRNHVNILTADAVIALPGSTGTAHEVEIAVRYGKPITAFLHHTDEMNSLPDVVRICLKIEDVAAFLHDTLKLKA